MATSGTIGTTVFNTRKIVDRAYRLCKLPPQVVAGEMLQVALDELYLILAGLATTGTPLWCITKYILPLYQGQITVECPTGVVSVLNAAIRDVSRITGTPFSSEGDATLAFDGDIQTKTTETAPAGHIGIELDTESLVTVAGFLPGATGTWDVALQYSDDGVTYTTFWSNSALAAVNGEWQWFDFEELPSKFFWRLKAFNATVLNVAELVFANNDQEIVMGNVNKDDYFNMPNKNFQGKPLQYWQDRQTPPNMKVWPAADAYSTFRQIVIYAHRHIEDVGTLQQQIEMPPRWLDAVSRRLGMYLMTITPDVSLTADERRERKDMADSAWSIAWMEERDPSNVTIAPNISPYTA